MAQQPDQRPPAVDAANRDTIRSLLERRYHGAVPVTDQMVDAVMAGLAARRPTPGEEAELRAELGKRFVIKDGDAAEVAVSYEIPQHHRPDGRWCPWSGCCTVRPDRVCPDRCAANEAAGDRREKVLIDLSDERRPQKPWLPTDDRDVTNGLVTLGPDGTPHCRFHGAMNRVDRHRSLWRCSEYRCGVGGELVAERSAGER